MPDKRTGRRKQNQAGVFMSLLRRLRKWLATWEQIFIGELLAVTIPVTEQRR
jgi:hypothetical protein